MIAAYLPANVLQCTIRAICHQYSKFRIPGVTLHKSSCIQLSIQAGVAALRVQWHVVNAVCVQDEIWGHWYLGACSARIMRSSE